MSDSIHEHDPGGNFRSGVSLWTLPKEIRAKIFLLTCEGEEFNLFGGPAEWLTLYHHKARGEFKWTGLGTFKDHIRTRRTLLALMQTCRNLHDETRPLLYRNIWGDFEKLQGPKRLRELTNHACPNWMTGLTMTIYVNPRLAEYFTTLMDKLEWGRHVRFLCLYFAYPDWTRGYMSYQAKEAYWYGEGQVAAARDKELDMVLRKVLTFWPKIAVYERVSLGFATMVPDVVSKWNGIFWDAEDQRLKTSNMYKYKKQTREEAADELYENTDGMSSWHYFDYWSDWDKYGNLRGSRINPRWSRQ